MRGLTATPLFGVSVTVFAYAIGVWMNKRAKTPLVNPMLVSLLLIIGVLLLFDIPYENYQIGGDMIEIFLAPATALIAVKIYQQFDRLRENWLPVLLGTAVGSAISMICVILLCRVFFLDRELLASLLPKSVTTAIAVSLSEQAGGLVPVTVAAVVITGVFGAAFAPLMIRVFGVKDPVEAGLAIGTCSHALGTTKAIEIGDVEGAMSGVALGVAGLITVVYTTFF
ncbi:MAG: LrgB family protein [Clostridia bacterium]|nr:LrgB family protein [Clostridia bacterium]